MGQYYKPISIEKKETIRSLDFDNGAKLMEHSYIGNPFVNSAERLLAKGGKWFGNHFVWCGDYAENEPDGTNLYENVCDISVSKLPYKRYRFLVNRSKKLYVDLSKVPSYNGGWKIHPLPLLTCEGNGQGGGDFFGKDPNNLIGSWTRDIIQPQTKKPKGNFTEIIFDLVEN